MARFPTRLMSEMRRDPKADVATDLLVILLPGSVPAIDFRAASFQVLKGRLMRYPDVDDEELTIRSSISESSSLSVMGSCVWCWRDTEKKDDLAF